MGMNPIDNPNQLCCLLSVYANLEKSQDVRTKVYLFVKIKLPQFTILDAERRVLRVGHVVEIGLHHPGDPVVGHEEIGLVVLFELVSRL